MMQFDPQLHTKAYLLADPKIAETLASQSNEWAMSPEAQDIEILKTGTVAFNLCLNANWAKTPAAQDLDVLELDGGWIAQSLAKTGSGWELTPAAQNQDVLALLGGLVALTLAQHSKSWAASPAAQQPAVLKLRGGEVAQHLAKTSVEWAKTPAAQNPEVLAINNHNVTYWLAKNSAHWPRSEAACDKAVLGDRADIFRAFSLSGHELSKGMSNRAFALKQFLIAGASNGIDLEFIVELEPEDYDAIIVDSIMEIDEVKNTPAEAILLSRLAVGFNHLAEYAYGATQNLNGRYDFSSVAATFEPLVLKYFGNEKNDNTFIESLPPSLEKDYLSVLYSKVQNEKLILCAQDVIDPSSDEPPLPMLY